MAGNPNSQRPPAGDSGNPLDEVQPEQTSQDLDRLLDTPQQRELDEELFGQTVARLNMPLQVSWSVHGGAGQTWAGAGEPLNPFGHCGSGECQYKQGICNCHCLNCDSAEVRPGSNADILQGYPEAFDHQEEFPEGWEASRRTAAGNPQLIGAKVQIGGGHPLTGMTGTVVNQTEENGETLYQVKLDGMDPERGLEVHERDWFTLDELEDLDGVGG